MSAAESQPVAQSHRVVALKYRPKNFEGLVGQDHISVALKKTIEQNKVGHAYLFTGARGVGKTSAARIFAKCLSCASGPSAEPCNTCDICQAIALGDDVDVLEIDGASNRGIDEIRSLRANAAIRPGRSRYKIYIIDEVHMLTMPAFNALLKTLEEPPGHVKFIFCTTDPQKIPVTVLSRCQRFDFSPVQTNEIADSLKRIANAEGIEIDDQAVALLARRANGSMRDSQSLLEQLLAFCDQTISVEHVHQLLGTADVGRIASLAASIVQRDAAATLNLINESINQGVHAGQLASQLLGYFRDAMAAKVGCGEDILITCTQADLDSLNLIAEQLGLETILAIIQILDASLVKMEKSIHERTLLEVAAIRICNLENLELLSDLVQQLAQQPDHNTKPRTGSTRQVSLQKVTAGNEPKKKEPVTNALGSRSAVPQGLPPASANDPKRVSEAQSSQPVSSGHAPSPALQAIAQEPDRSRTDAHQPQPAGPPNKTPATQPHANAKSVSQKDLESLWTRVIAEIGDLSSEMAADFESVQLRGGDQVVVTLKTGYNTQACSKPERLKKFESALAHLAGCSYRVQFETSKRASESPQSSSVRLSRAQQIRKLQEHDFVKRATTLFDAEIANFIQRKPQ